jgi:negative regulator of replication initiation
MTHNESWHSSLMIAKIKLYSITNLAYTGDLPSFTTRQVAFFMRQSPSLLEFGKKTVPDTNGTVAWCD